MQLSTFLLSAILLLLHLRPAISRPADPTISQPTISQPFSINTSDKIKQSSTCSANQSGSIPNWASDPGWAASMISCLNQMDNDGWNGAECKPVATNGTSLGPTFGFYKGEDHYNEGGQDCYNQCKDCLLDGINWQQAQTTSCEYHYWSKVESRHKHCDVGFTYGTWDRETA